MEKLENTDKKLYNLNIKDVDVFVLWLEKLMQLEEREN
jgi:hypothetical protein